MFTNIKRFKNLISNEVTKSLYGKTTIIIIIIGLILNVGLALIDLSKDTDNTNWRNQQLAEVTKIEEKMQSLNPEDEDSAVATLNESRLKLLNYSLDNNIPLDVKTPIKFMDESKTILSVLILLIIVLSANTIYKEYLYGTIKPLLTKPFFRREILFSKQISIMFISFVLIIIQLLLSFIIGIVFFRNNGFSTVSLSLSGDSVVEVNLLKNIFEFYLLSYLKIITLIVITIMIAIFIKRSVLPILISLIVWFGNDIFQAMFSNYSFYKFTIFPHIDLTQYLITKKISLEGNTLTFSLLALLVYIFIFQFISYYKFSKEDVR